MYLHEFKETKYEGDDERAPPSGMITIHDKLTVNQWADNTFSNKDGNEITRSIREYNNSLKESLKNINFEKNQKLYNYKITHIRNVRGDGNCFYRAIYFKMIELGKKQKLLGLIINLKNGNKIYNINDKLINLHDSDQPLPIQRTTTQKAKQKVIQFLTETLTIDEIIQRINKNETLDRCIILMIRCILVQWIEENLDKSVNKLQISDMKKFAEDAYNNLMTMGKDAEEPFIGLNSKAFDLNIAVIKWNKVDTLATKKDRVNVLNIPKHIADLLKENDANAGNLRKNGITDIPSQILQNALANPNLKYKDFLKEKYFKTYKQVHFIMRNLKLRYL